MRDPEARTNALKNAIAILNPPDEPSVDAEMVRQVNDTVWWRRISYFACLFATLFVVAFPYAAGLYSTVAKTALLSIPWIGSGLVHAIEDWSRWFTPVWRGWVADLFQAVGTVVPAYAKAWLDALAKRPLEMLAALALVAIFFGAGGFLAQRIHDRARFAWHRSRRKIYLDWAVSSARSSLTKAFVLALVTVLLLVTAWTGGAGPEVSGTMILLSVLMIVVIAWRAAILHRLGRDRSAIESGEQALPSPPTLKVARFIRCNTHLVYIYEIFANRVIPLVFAAALAYAVVGVAYHAVLRVFSSAGMFCSASFEGGTTLPQGFETTQLCWASGVKVLAGHSYEVQLTTEHDWTDKTIPADAAGVSSTPLVHVLAEPMKRSWSGRWFQPIVRVGRLGDDEHLMTAVGPDNSIAKVRLTAERDAELFLYVNDAILLLPGKTAFFYINNHGKGNLSICELSGPPGGDLADKTCPNPGSTK